VIVEHPLGVVASLQRRFCPEQSRVEVDARLDVIDLESNVHPFHSPYSGGRIDDDRFDVLRIDSVRSVRRCRDS